jgi:hypothetical protein
MSVLCIAEIYVGEEEETAWKHTNGRVSKREQYQ